MYCSLNEAWGNNNTIESLNKRYESNIDKLSTKKFNIDSKLNNTNNDSKSNYPKTTIHDDNIFENMTNECESTEDINTEDIMLKTEEEPKSILKNYLSNEELVNKVLQCPECRNMIIKKLNLINNPLNILQNNEIKEVTILILIGLIVIILLDLFFKIAK